MSIIKLCFKPRRSFFREVPWRRGMQLLHRQEFQSLLQQEEDDSLKIFSLKFSFPSHISHKKLGLIGLIFVKVANRGKGGNFQIKKWYVDFCSFFFEKKKTIFKIILISYSTCPLNCLKYCSRRALNFDLQEVFGLFNSLLRKNFLQFLRKILCSGCLC